MDQGFILGCPGPMSMPSVHMQQDQELSVWCCLCFPVQRRGSWGVGASQVSPCKVGTRKKNKRCMLSGGHVSEDRHKTH